MSDGVPAPIVKRILALQRERDDAEGQGEIEMTARIAAEARVAHLEGALREIADEPSIRTYNEITIRHTCPDVASSALAASPTMTVEEHPQGCGGTYEGVGFVAGPLPQAWRARCLNHGRRLVESTNGSHGPFRYVAEERNE